MRCQILLTALAIASQAVAQIPLELKSDSGSCQVINRMPIGFVVLVQQPASIGTLSETVVVGANATAPCVSIRSPKAWMAQREPITMVVSAKRKTVEGEAARLGGMSIPELQKLITDLHDTIATDLLETAAGRQQMRNVQLLASTQLSQRLDEIRIRRNDPVDVEMQQQALSYAAESGKWDRFNNIQSQIQQQRRQDALVDGVDTLVAMSAAYTAADSQKRALLAQERDQYQAMAATAETRKIQIENALEATAIEVDAYRHYFDRLIAELRAAPGGIVPGNSLQPQSEIRKSAGSRGNVEHFEVTMKAPPELAVVFGEVQFNKGAPHRTILRRLNETDQWAGIFHWPVEAQQARLSLVHPGNGGAAPVPGSIALGRQPLKAIADQAIQALASIKKKYKETKARADGMDGSRTISIP